MTDQAGPQHRGRRAALRAMALLVAVTALWLRAQAVQAAAIADSLRPPPGLPLPRAVR